MKVLCLDIDDCLWPSNQTWLGNMDDGLDILKLNMKRIKGAIDQFKVKIFITSSWSSILKVENTSLFFSDIFPNYGEKFVEEGLVLNAIKDVVDGHVLGISSGNRIRDIKKLLDGGHQVVALDDMDLSEIVHDNYNFILVEGMITNHISYKIQAALEGNLK